MINIKKRARQSMFWRAARLFDKRDRLKILAVMCIQVTLSFLDLLGVALVGLLGALGVAGIQSRTPTGTVYEVLSFIGIAQLDFQKQALVLGLLSVSILIIRTIFSVIFTKRTLYFLSRRAAQISEKAVHALFRLELARIQKWSSQETIFAMTNGITSLTLGVIGTAVAITADGSLLIVIGMGLIIIDPVMALGTAVLFGTAALILHKLMHSKALNLGIEQAELGISSNEVLLESLNAYRDVYIRNSLNNNADSFAQKRFRLSNNIAESSFMPFVSKYVIETLILVGALGLSAIQFILEDAEHAIATLALFMAAGTRLAPAILRIQQSIIAMKSASGNASKSIEFLDQLQLEFEPEESVNNVFTTNHAGFIPEIYITNLSAKYPESGEYVLANINLHIKPGDSVALVGESGSGKSTLIDVVLGILKPDKGSVTISSQSPTNVLSNWPGSIGYVPQDVYIKNDSIAANVTLGFEEQDVPQENLLRALKQAQLLDLIESNSKRLDSVVGESGSMLSGGQKQRLGIARALVTSPGLLILDEATSALDGKTENEITDAIASLKGQCTIIVVAHRLSTVRDMDKVIYLQKGKILAMGTFNEVRNQVPDFDSQAKLMGL